jgi:hypothetical protein
MPKVWLITGSSRRLGRHLADAKWRALSESTDHDDATAAQKDPLAGLRRG